MKSRLQLSSRSYERETQPEQREEKRHHLEEVETEYHEQLEAYRQNSALRQSAPRGPVVAGQPSLPQPLLAELWELLEKAEPLNPALLTADDYFLRGNTAYILKRYDEAIADYSRSLELRPDDPVTLYSRGITLAKLERYDESLADYNHALELEPDDPRIFNNRGNTLDELQRYDEALADFNRSLALRPDHAETLSNRGGTLVHLKRYDEALADVNHALELIPDHPDILINRPIALVHLERYDEALADVNRALELRPGHAATLYQSACAFSLMGRLREALEHLQEAISRDAKCRKMAREDEDFENLRSDPTLGPEFERLVAEPED